MRECDKNLFTQFRFALLYGSDKHVANTGSWQSVQTTTNAMDSNNVQVLTT